METNSVPDYPRGITFEQVWAALEASGKEFDRRMKEWDERFEKEKKEREESDAREKEERKAQEKEFNRRFGDFTDRIGQIMECLVEPKLYNKFQALGISVNRTCRRIEFEYEKGKVFEIDVLLENNDTSIAVEVKTKVSYDDVEKHMERMEKLRKYENNKRSRVEHFYYGAIAGAVFEKEVQEFALKCGFFVMVPSGDTFDIIFPEGENKPRIW